MKILIVDDSATMRNIIQLELQKAGFQDPVLCESGEKALEIMETGPIDLVLLDWHMDGLSGLEVLRIMRNNPALKKIPVIMLTIEKHERSVQEALSSGADDYMVKPLNGRLLKEKLSAIRRKD